MTEVKAGSIESSFEIVENETVDGYNAVLAVHQALNTKPIDFGNTIKSMLADRIQKAVDGKRTEIAANVFNGLDQEVEADNSAPEEDNEEGTVESELEAKAEGEEEAEEITPEE